MKDSKKLNRLGPSWDFQTLNGKYASLLEIRRKGMEGHVQQSSSGLFVIKFIRCISCETRNHPQTIQTTHKPEKPPTNQPSYPQTSQVPNKSPTNQPKVASLFPWRHFLWTATFSLTILSEKRNECIFFISLLDFAFCLHQCTIHYHP